jgi:hypothetical protein
MENFQENNIIYPNSYIQFYSTNLTNSFLFIVVHFRFKEYIPHEHCSQKLSSALHRFNNSAFHELHKLLLPSMYPKAINLKLALYTVCRKSPSYFCCITKSCHVITIIVLLDSIHNFVLYLKHSISEAGFCLCLQVKPIQLGPVGIASSCLQPPVRKSKSCYN